MPSGKYGMQEEWEKEGDQEVVMEFLLPTGIFLKFPVSPNDTIKSIKKVSPLTPHWVHYQQLLQDSIQTFVEYFVDTDT